MNFHLTRHAIRKKRNQNRNEMSNHIKRELADTKCALERFNRYGSLFVFFFVSLSFVMGVMGYFSVDKYLIDLQQSSNSNLNSRRHNIDKVTSSSHAINVQQLDDASSAVVDSLPNILLIGVQKGGSTAISQYLFSQGVCGGETFPDKYGEPNWYSKEMHFFNDPLRFKRGLDFYEEHYQHCVNNLEGNKNKPFIMDATPGYFLVPKKVFEVYKNKPNLKIIVSLREPMSRELSLYNHKADLYRKGSNMSMAHGIAHENGTIKTFGESTFMLQKGRKTSYYALHLARWFKLFDPPQILVLSYEKDVIPGTPAKERIQEFLGASLLLSDKHVPFRTSNTHESPQKVRMHNVTCSTLEPMQPIVDGWNKELYELLAAQKPRGISPFPKFEPAECKLDQ